LPEPVVAQARNLGGQQWLIDGEALGDTLVAFDLLEEASADLRREPYSRRLAVLYDMLAPNGQGALRSLGTAIGTKHKKNLLKSLQERRAEGIVFKRHDAPYSPGRPASGGSQLKCKFYCTASCIVTAINRGKRSVAIELCDGQQRVGVGNVTIPAGRELPKPGQIIELRYLYAYQGGSLFQPVFLDRRDDLAAAECKLTQLKFRAQSEEDDA
jgi:bifunctional non-homologous end joining protein LigD